MVTVTAVTKPTKQQGVSGVGPLNVLEHTAAAVFVPEVTRPVMMGPLPAGPACPEVSFPGPYVRRGLVSDLGRPFCGVLFFAMGEQVLDRMCRQARRYPVELSDLP